MSISFYDRLSSSHPVTAWANRKKLISSRQMDVQLVEIGSHHSLIFATPILGLNRLAWVGFMDYGDSIGAYWTTLKAEFWDKHEAAEPALRIDLNICNPNIDELELYLKQRING